MPTKQKDGRYRTRVVVGHRANGDPITKYASGKTKKELAENVARIKAEQMGVRPSQRRDVTFREFGGLWYATYKKPNLRPSTAEMYAYILDIHLYPTLGMRQLRAITPVELQAFVNTLAGKSLSLINKVILTLRQVFKRAMIDGLIERDPTMGLITPKGTQKEKRALTDAERKAITATGAGHPDGLLLMLLYYAGLRRGEAVGLQWGDIDFAANRINIRRQVSYVNSVAYLQEPKTKAGFRTVPLLSALRDALWPLRGLPGAYILVDPDTGSHLSSYEFQRRWNRLIKAANTPGVSPHILRHNFASLLYESGVDELKAQRILGHSDYRVTANIYTHLRETALDDAAEMLEARIDPSKRKRKRFVAKMLPGSSGLKPR